MKVLIADDHAIVREGLKQLVASMEEISLVDESMDGLDVLAKIEKNKYDLLIMDISMPGISGMDVLKRMKETDKKVNVLILSIHPEEQYAIQAFKLGASGYLCKDSIYEEIVAAIRKIISGGKYVSSSLAEKIIPGENFDRLKSPHNSLSEREFQIMCMIARGKSVKKIAEELIISDKTVSTYRSRILEKMGMKTNADLTYYAIKNNMIE